jgi:hypothetical protein
LIPPSDRCRQSDNCLPMAPFGAAVDREEREERSYQAEDARTRGERDDRRREKLGELRALMESE